jgi:multidrug efflux pump subunit AcrA (membrane-fusion protein)
MVYVIDTAGADAKEGTVRPVIVALGVASGGAVEVAGDLRPEQLVVVEGNERLMPGQKATISRIVPAANVKLPSSAKPVDAQPTKSAGPAMPATSVQGG